MRPSPLIILVSLGLTGSSLAGPTPATPEAVALGKARYLTYCLPCHGDKADGKGPVAVTLDPKPRDLTVPLEVNLKYFSPSTGLEQLFKAINVGVPNTSMGGYAHLPEADRWAMVHYMKATWFKPLPPPPPAMTPAPPARPAGPAGTAKAGSPVKPTGSKPAPAPARR